MNHYCVILAGGKGKRLWPCSRSSKPKQFIDIFGFGKTPLQQTYERFQKIIPDENIFISTNEDYVDLVREQLPNVHSSNILAEPLQRNTAPSMAWAALKIKTLDESANIVVTPADTMVLDEVKFKQDMLSGLEFVDDTTHLLTVGVKATRPETEYGYIQIDSETSSSNIFKVKSFTEKPTYEFATTFIQTGEFFWNTGIFICSVQGLLNAVNNVLPVDITEYSSYPNVSLDQGVLEKSTDVYVITCEFGWADLGTWHNVYEVLPKNENENVVIDSQVILDDCKKSIVKVPKGKLAVVNGLEDYIVVDDGNVLLISRKEDSSKLIRKYINEIQIFPNNKFL